MPAAPSAGAVDTANPVSADSLAGAEQITVFGKRRPLAGPLDVPDLPGEDMSRYHRSPDYLTRHRGAPCSTSYASVGGHEDRGSSLATGIGASGCD